MKLILLLFLTLNIYATQTTSIGSVEIKQELEKQNNLSQLNYELKVLELKKNIATVKQDCIKNNGCMPTPPPVNLNLANIAENNNNNQKKLELDLHNKQAAINSMNNLKLIAILNDRAMFDHSAKRFKVGDDLGSGVIIQKINSTYVRVSYQDITSDIYMNWDIKYSEFDRSKN
jgi:hypothetical protein